jgi:hypothetical protein
MSLEWDEVGTAVEVMLSFVVVVVVGVVALSLFSGGGVPLRLPDIHADDGKGMA